MSNHNSPSYSLTIRVRFERKPGALARVATTIGFHEALVGSIPIIRIEKDHVIREFDIYARDEEHEKRIVTALENLPGVEVLGVTDRTFAYHEGGKIDVVSRKHLGGREDLSMAYTPGVSRVSLAVAKDIKAAYQYTMKGNSVAVITDGTAVLGLGNIGPYGALPVMEGKAVIFKEFAGINAFPLCLNVTDVESIVSVIKAVSVPFAGINLEDISAPRCFEIERRLNEELDIPVFHDDQHGTAIAVLAALKNSLIRVEKELADVKIVISGTGAAGVACVRTLLEAGVKDVVCCDTHGAIYVGRSEGMNPVKEEIAQLTNPRGLKVNLKGLLEGADVFIGVSAGNLLKPSDLKVMAHDAIVFALANPVPEVDPWEALDYARIVATGRSDFPNQINNALVFPGIFRGALDARAKKITSEMRIAAAAAIADLVDPDDLADQYIIPGIFNREVCPAVAKAVRQAAEKSGAR
ncbi:MAG: NAD-dependent malic enzyme [Desulfomonile tiedjei]|uniref:NAD-dependent malic enzyme n=1 Tax=Desulfomonile tiedjei TaxID=2358 RepID=A0A9D6UXZ6_9BACT|nr:NAD-dependent malic enzyme [Desulfomonile tiedjei]